MSARSDVMHAVGPGWLTVGAARRLRRPLPTVLARCAVVALVIIGTAAVHIPGRPATLCLLRAVTGIPCPFCGGTTAAVHLGHGDVPGAVAASPLAVALLVLLPLVGVLPRPRWWASRRLRRGAIVAVLALAEVWQLSRFWLLPGHA